MAGRKKFWIARAPKYAPQFYWIYRANDELRKQADILDEADTFEEAKEKVIKRLKDDIDEMTWRITHFKAMTKHELVKYPGGEADAED